MKNNSIIVILLLYLAIFGISIKESNHTNNENTCEVIMQPKILQPKPLPNVSKEHIDNKEYIIRMLIKHINSQNEHITTTNKQLNEIYQSYMSCIK